MGDSDGLAQVAQLGTILGVWAHPDDETYLSGGVMAAAVAQGQRVVCVTATRGEAGSLDEERWPPARLAEIRTSELADAFAHLGLSEHHWLDYPDGGCAEVPEEEAALRLVELMSTVRPSTVLTFGPDGITGHDDHVAVSRWVSRAVQMWVEAREPRPRVLQAAETIEWYATVEDVFDSQEIYMGFEPPRIPRAQAAFLVTWSDPWLAAKVEAIREQVSQTSGMFERFGDEGMRRAIAEEAFVDG
ncbi:MAG: PIG-L family deacetylase [Candidatus Nanopelagicales bacterium]